VACVFAGDLIDFFEDAEGAERDVFKVANGSADKVQAAQGFFIVAECAHAFESSTRSVGGRSSDGKNRRAIAQRYIGRR
jgi:hypothetical protein